MESLEMYFFLAIFLIVATLVVTLREKLRNEIIEKESVNLIEKSFNGVWKSERVGGFKERPGKFYYIWTINAEDRSLVSETYHGESGSEQLLRTNRYTMLTKQTHQDGEYDIQLMDSDNELVGSCTLFSYDEDTFDVVGFPASLNVEDGAMPQSLLMLLTRVPAAGEVLSKDASGEGQV